MPVVDFHVHTALIEDGRPGDVAHVAANQGVDFDRFVAQYADPVRFLGYLDANAVDYAVILAALTPVTAGVARNEYVADFCAASPRLLPFASLNPYITPEPARELERLVRELGFRGLKLYPTYSYYYPNDRMLYPLYAMAQTLGIPVMCHTGSSVFPGSTAQIRRPTVP